MDNYEFECINYSDEEDKKIPGSWYCLRSVYQRCGLGEWNFAQDRARIRLARQAFQAGGRLAQPQGGKVSLLIDHGLGMCMVCVENLSYIQGKDRLEKKRILELLTRADNFTFTCALNKTLCLDLGYRAFRKVKT